MFFFTFGFLIETKVSLTYTIDDIFLFSKKSLDEV